MALTLCLGSLSMGTAQPSDQPIPGASPSILHSAAIYADWVDRMSAHQGQFAGPADVARSLQAGAGWEPRQMYAGMIALAAMVATREPEFVAAVQAAPETQIEALWNNPAGVYALHGAMKAGKRSAETLAEHHLALDAAAGRLKSSAYQIQHEAWASQPVSDPEGRLSRVKEQALRPAIASPEMINSAILVASQTPAETDAAPIVAAPAMTRALALAALMIRDMAQTELPYEQTQLASNPVQDHCMRMVRINLNQCLASARPHYEDVFCLGKHAIEETGHCIRKGSGLSRISDSARMAAAPQ